MKWAATPKALDAATLRWVAQQLDREAKLRMRWSHEFGDKDAPRQLSDVHAIDALSWNSAAKQLRNRATRLEKRKREGKRS